MVFLKFCTSFVQVWPIKGLWTVEIPTEKNGISESSRLFGLLNPSANGARIRSGRVYEVFAFGAFGILYIQA